MQNKAVFVQNKRLIGIMFAATCLLLVPAVAMQITSEVAWGAGDFVVAGALLFGTGLLFELAARREGNVAYRAAVGVALATALLLVWANLAVGIIGSEDNRANLMVVGVLAVGLIGACVARLQPRGMAGVMFATAGAQMLVGVIALVAGLGIKQLILNEVFALLWVGSGLLFRRASEPVYKG
ncbi:MAG: hypothetical protein ACR2IE_01810 [Candidatus Sumerlaeaceae bacterium]